MVAYSLEHSYKAVAKRLGKSQSVVDHQLLSARKKMGVTSMAEAMFLLAERNARAGGESRATSDSHLGPEPEPRVSRKGHRASKRATLAAIAGISILALGVVWICYWLGARPPNYVRLSDEEIVSRIRALHRSDEEVPENWSQSKERVSLVTLIADRSWREMWGPEEDHLKSLAEPISSDVIAAFQWALAHDPDAAVQIIGNGHRLFSLIPELREWSRKMVDSARTLQATTRQVEFGRVLCGVALVHWQDNRPLTRKAGAEAFRIFANVPDRDKVWDEANALHHESLGYESLDRVRLDLCSRALSLWTESGDARGIAQGWLSLAQAGWDGPNHDDPAAAATAAYNALSQFMDLRNENMINEATVELSHKISLLSGSIQNRGLSLKVRAVFAKLARGKHISHQFTEQFALLADCIEIDERSGERNDLLEDVNSLLEDITGPVDGPSVAAIAGCYRSLCRQTGVTPSPLAMVYARNNPEFAKRGESMSPHQIATLARSLRPD